MKNSNLLYSVIAILATLVVVVGIVAIVEGRSKTVVLKVDAPDQSVALNNAQRKSDMNTILNAVYQWEIDHDGQIPPTIPVVTTEICRSEAIACANAALDLTMCRASGTDCAGLVDLDLLLESYLVAMPSDPLSTDYRSTRYTIAKQADGRIAVAAPDAQGTQISLTR